MHMENEILNSNLVSDQVEYPVGLNFEPCIKLIPTTAYVNATSALPWQCE